MRTLGMAILGLFAGLAIGFLLLSEVIGRLVVANGNVPNGWALVIGFGPQIFAALGAVLAVVIANRRRLKSGQGGNPR